MFNNLKYGQGELTTPYMYVSGLVGANQNNNGMGSVENCYVTGTQLQVIDAAGELIGVNWGNVTNSYTAANGLSYYEVYSPSYGEAIYPTYMSRNMHYVAGTVTGVHYDASSSVSLDGKGTAHSSRSELKQQDTFEGWDFENIWTLDPEATEENGGFPVFGTTGSTDPGTDPDPTPAGTITVTPADITVYVGGEAYEGTVDEDGQIASGASGLPEPGFRVDLPESMGDVAVTDLVFQEKNGTRSWHFETYDGQPDTEAYRLVPTEGQDPTRVQFTTPEGNVVVSDEFTVGLEVNTSFEMALYKGEGATAVGDIVVEYDGKTYAVDSSPTGTLTVRGTEDPQFATVDDAAAGAEPEAGEPAATDEDGTVYAINGGDVEVADDSDVALLFDDIIHHEGADREQALEERAVEELGGEASDYGMEFKYLDLVDTANGNAWVAATDENGDPTDVTVYWPLPEGADPDTVQVLHFEGLHREMDSDDIDAAIADATVTEVAGAKVEDDHVVFQIGSTGFSPFAVVWKDAEEPVQQTGSLTVTKQATGEGADAQKAFDITVTLSDTTINGTYGDMTFANGVATVALKAGTSATATGLPAGVTFTVSEADYTADGYTATIDPATGTIAADQTAAVTVTNAYADPGSGEEPGGGEDPDKPGGGDEKPENPGGGDKSPGGDGNPGSGQPAGGNTAGDGSTSNGSGAKGEGLLPTTGDPLMLGAAACISAGALSLVGAAYWRRRHRA